MRINHMFVCQISAEKTLARNNVCECGHADDNYMKVFLQPACCSALNTLPQNVVYKLRQAHQLR